MVKIEHIFIKLFPNLSWGYWGRFSIRFRFDHRGWGRRKQGLASRWAGLFDWLADLIRWSFVGSLVNAKIIKGNTSFDDLAC
jgi:hypothetical protein